MRVVTTAMRLTGDAADGSQRFDMLTQESLPSQTQVSLSAAVHITILYLSPHLSIDADTGEC